MTTREWRQLKIEIDDRTKTAKMKKQCYSCGSHNCIVRRTEQYYMRIDEDPTIKQQPHASQTTKRREWRMKLDQKVKCRLHTQTQDETYMRWAQSQEETHRRNKLNLIKKRIKGRQPHTEIQFMRPKQNIAARTPTQQEQCYTCAKGKCLRSRKAEYQANGGTITNQNSPEYPEWRRTLDRMVRCKKQAANPKTTSNKSRK